MAKQFEPVEVDPVLTTNPLRDFAPEREPDSAAVAEAGGAATIGPSISIRGDVTGAEDLVIQGRVEGNIELANNNLTVGANGWVKAGVHARGIEIRGQVEGDLRGDQHVAIRRTGKARGKILAPRVTLEDGCRFQGSIDMGASTAK